MSDNECQGRELSRDVGRVLGCLEEKESELDTHLDSMVPV